MFSSTPLNSFALDVLSHTIAKFVPSHRLLLFHFWVSRNEIQDWKPSWLDVPACSRFGEHWFSNEVYSVRKDIKELTGIPGFWKTEAEILMGLLRWGYMVLLGFQAISATLESRRLYLSVVSSAGSMFMCTVYTMFSILHFNFWRRMDEGALVMNQITFLERNFQGEALKLTRLTKMTASLC